MGFIKKFGSDPLAERIYALIYGVEGIGKTRMVLDLVKKHGDFVVLFSIDRGDLAVKQEPDTYEGKMAIGYPRSLRELRELMQEGESLIAQLAKKGVPRSRIWVVVDTATHLQSKLLAEARKINVRNPESRDVRNEYVRDAVVEVDYGINLAHMSELADFLVDVKANVVVTALEKSERVKRDETGRVIPAISGQSATRLQGDADVILRLTKDKKGKRYLVLNAADALGKDRSARLDDREPADLKLLQQKVTGTAVPALPAGSPVDGDSEENGADAESTPAPQN